MKNHPLGQNIQFTEKRISLIFAAFSAGIILAANYFISRQDNLYQVDILTSELRGSANGLSNLILRSDLTAIEQSALNKIEANSTIRCITISEYIGEKKVNLAAALRTKKASIIPLYSDSLIIEKCGNPESKKNQSNYNFIRVPITLSNQLLGEIEVLSWKTQNFDSRLLTRYLATSSAILIIVIPGIYLSRKTIRANAKLKEQELNSALERATLSEITTQNIYKAFESSNDGWWKWSPDTKKIYLSTKIISVLGIEQCREDALIDSSAPQEDWWKNYIASNKKVEDFINCKDKIDRSIDIEFINRKEYEIENAILTRSILPSLDNDNSQEIYFTIRDTTDKLRQINYIETLAFGDNLTGLSNRVAFELELEKISQERSRKAYRYSLYIIDMDNFKQLNDSYGHVTGDLFIKEIGRRLQTTLRPTDFKARIGGDEFVVITRFPYSDNHSIENKSRNVGEKIIRELSKKFLVNGHVVQHTCSIGICMDSQQDEKNIMSILDYADVALYDAKEKGKNMLSFYDKDMHNKTRKTATIKQQITSALEQNQISVAMQPVVRIDFSSLKPDRIKPYEIVGYEALFRCSSINANVQDVITTAEKTGLISKITEAVVQEVGKAIHSGQLSLTQNQTVSVNVSAIELLDQTFAASFMHLLDKNKINPEAIYIEVTETAFIDNLDLARENINQLKKQGVRFAMDDFGTGYASIQILRYIDIDRIKIDRSYTSKLDNKLEQSLIKTVIWMARSLNMDLVAEGIEKKEQMRILSGLGCEFGQGYLFNSNDN